MYEDLKLFTEIAKEQGANIIEPIFTDQIIMDFRTTYKCMTCVKYKKNPNCPPNIPDYEYFQKLIKSYKYGLIIGKKYNYNGTDEFNHIRKDSGPRLQNILLTLEQQAFQRNYYWAITFTGGSCRACNSCPTEGKICATPSKGRISMEAVGIDVFETCKALGIEISPFPHPIENGVLYRIGLLLLE